MKKIFLIIWLLIANDAFGQSCIPKPDCADMGYTVTSCVGAYLKCPFDTTKMACLGSTTVTCPDGYEFNGSACVAHTHSYSCPSGYSTSSSGMITPASTAKVCACGATSGTCYTCASNPCAGVTCPTAKSCTTYGCKTNSSATSCCASVCTACYTDNCHNRTAVVSSCPSNASCSYFSDCSSKISSYSCKSGYYDCGNYCCACKTVSSCPISPSEWAAIPSCTTAG